MREIDHQARCEAGFSALSSGCSTAGRIKIRFIATAQDAVAILVTHGRNDSGVAGLGDREEVVRRIGRANGVDRNPHIAIGTILEADRTGKPGSEFAMHLRLGGAGTNRAPGNQVSGVMAVFLRRRVHPDPQLSLIHI